MPEGDTIHLARLRLEPILTGRVVERFWARKLRGYRPRAGQVVEAVRAVGKHLLVDFDRDLTLDTHMGMAGSWRARSAGADISRALANPRLRVHIETEAGSALCFSAPTIQTYLRSAAVTPVSGLGPDLAADDPDIAAAVERARHLRRPDDPLADVLLDQEVAAGIGNVYKSECLHAARLHPFLRLDQVDDERLAALFATAAAQLNRNVLTPGRARATTPHGGYFVYGRWRQPCLRCQTPIERAYRGAARRSTYWCPTCQPAHRP